MHRLVRIERQIQNHIAPVHRATRMPSRFIYLRLQLFVVPLALAVAVLAATSASNRRAPAVQIRG